MRLETNPEPKQVAGFGRIWLPLALVVAAYVFGWRRDAMTLAWVLVALAGVAMVLGWVRPVWLRPVFVGLMIIGFPIGWVVNHLVLALVYYGMIVPYALVMRAAGRDVLGRAFDPQARTYWIERSPAPVEVKRYLQQF